MRLIRCLPIPDIHEADHSSFFNLRVEGIEPRVANLLKQELLSLGAGAATDGRDLDPSVSETDALLMGTRKQLEKLALKLATYPQLQSIGRSLKQVLDNAEKTSFTIRCGKRTYPLGERTLLMGVLNVTPDSFSDGSLYLEKEKAIAHGLKMAEEGADIIDIGGESTRPGSKPLDVEQELRRVIPVIESLAKEDLVPLSIDTYKATVARAAIEAGAQMVNDISGLRFDPGLAQVVAERGLPLVLMHMRGTPQTMQQDVHYESLFSEILLSLQGSIAEAEFAGVEPGQIIIDPGIGFGKTLEQNLLIIRNLYEFRSLGKPILMGTSRKSFIGKILNADVKDRLEGTLATVTAAVLHGAHIIRCHDVLQVKRAVDVADAIRAAGHQAL